MISIIQVVINFLAILISLILISIIYAELNKTKINFTFKKILVLFLSTFLILYFNSFDVFIIRVINSLFCFTMPYILFLKIDKNAILILYIVVLSNVLDLLFSIIVNYIDIKCTFCFLSDAILTVLISVIILILAKTKFLHKLFFIIKYEIKSYYIYNFLIVLFTYFLLNNINYTYSLSIIDRLSLLIVFLLILILSLFNILKSIKNENIKKYNNRILNNLKNNKSYITSRSKYIHNLKNKLLLILTLPEKYWKFEIENLLQLKQNKITYLANGNEDNSINILTYINELCKKSKINYKRFLFSNNINNEIDIICNMKLYTFICEILGVLVDNAIEATKENKNNKIIINLDENSNYYLINVANKYNNNIDINKIGKMFYTTKKSGNGIGLYSINNNHKVKFQIKITDEYFISKVKIKKDIH